MRSTVKALRRSIVVVAVAAFGVIGASSPALAATSVGWDRFPQVSREDRIQIYTRADVLATGRIIVCLESAPYITWWKGVVLRDWNGGVIRDLYTVNGNHGPTCTTVNLDYVRQLELWKAKAFGIHTHMYTLSHDSLRAKDRDQVLFRWTAD
jgi:hypothetical protein